MRDRRHAARQASWIAALCAAGMVFSPESFARTSSETGLLALSEIKREELPAPGAATKPAEPEAPTTTVPAPEPITPSAGPSDTTEPATENPDEPGIDDMQGADPARPNVDPNAPIPEVQYDLARLPAPVRDLHGKLVAAAEAGQIEALRGLLTAGESPTQLSLGGAEGDPIAFIKSLSGDEGGQEILAILLEVLNAGYVHLSPGTPEELYVWPYFFAVPLDKLTDRQRVELFKLVTSGDYEDMKTFGTYIFYRIGISPDGKWRFFLSGE